MIIESISMALENIKSNKMRSFLTMLGIVIGVAAVIGLITIVQGVTDTVMDQFSGLGAGSLTVSAPGTPLKRGLSDNDLEELSNVEGVESVSPTASLNGSATYKNTVADEVSIQGNDVIYFLHNDVIQSGRCFNEAEMSGNTMVCIVDKNFIKNVMNGDKVIGNSIKINGYSYNIVGIKKEDDNLSMAFTDTSNLDGTVIVPYRNALAMAGSNNVSQVQVFYKDGYSSTAVENNLRSALDNIYNDADGAYMVINMESLMSAMDTVNGMLTTMLGGIASIALLVGGIGIMNMMLVSVSERTTEIGLRKALGAEPARIQAQFLTESIVLSMIGGFIGVILGMLIAAIAAQMLNTKFTASPGAILLGVGFSAAVGILFGWAPARRASRLNPIDALRSE